MRVNLLSNKGLCLKPKNALIILEEAVCFDEEYYSRRENLGFIFYLFPNHMSYMLWCSVLENVQQRKQHRCQKIFTKIARRKSFCSSQEMFLILGHSLRSINSWRYLNRYWFWYLTLSMSCLMTCSFIDLVWSKLFLNVLLKLARKTRQKRGNSKLFSQEIFTLDFAARKKASTSSFVLSANLFSYIFLSFRSKFLAQSTIEVDLLFTGE